MELIEILGKIVSIKSVSGDENEICLWVSGFLRKNGFSVEMQEAAKHRWNIFAKKGNPKAIFFGHVDTVPKVEGWTKDPFSLVREGDRLYGLGAWDMKGGVAAILHNAQYAKNMAILLTVDEEEEGLGAKKAIQNKEFFKGMRIIVSGEAGNTPSTYGGLGHVAVGRKGCRDISFRKRLEGGHAAIVGNDWVEWLHKAVSKTKMAKSRIIIRNFHATSKGFSVPDSAEADIEVIVEPEEKNKDFGKVVSEMFGVEKGSLIEKKSEYPPYSFAEDPEISNVVGIVREFTKPVFVIGDSVGDENVLAKLGIPIVIMGPEGRNEHHADEWVSLKSLREIADLYKRISDSY
ncbi:MAG: M20 family metallopeptidase [Candidatus Micrarchaeota archaeon]|nr:M20 family metallopeptidase [Candidatus Micrarchaeota archaeon]